ncbi:MAG: BtrH N-terminal domain-containing protein [Actinobacteria bacterium]|nr:BtrH N-terminal domain-containing protein [Actinomycetota bacterium]
MKVVKKFRHNFHCGSTALANTAGYHGHGLSESMCSPWSPSAGTWPSGVSFPGSDVTRQGGE